MNLPFFTRLIIHLKAEIQQFLQNIKSEFQTNRSTYSAVFLLFFKIAKIIITNPITVTNGAT